MELLALGIPFMLVRMHWREGSLKRGSVVGPLPQLRRVRSDTCFPTGGGQRMGPGRMSVPDADLLGNGAPVTPFLSTDYL